MYNTKRRGRCIPIIFDRLHFFPLIFIFIVLFPSFFFEDRIVHLRFSRTNEWTYKCLLTLLFMEVDKVRINDDFNLHR